MCAKRVEVLGVPVDCVDMEHALNVIEMFLKDGIQRSVIAVNPEKIIKAQKDTFLLNFLKGAGLLIPDGIGLVLAVRLFGLGSLNRVPGSELMPEICKYASQKGYKVFLYGGSPAVNNRTVEVLRSRYPGLQIVGNANGYLAKGDMPSLISNINDSGAEILFVGLGSPKQELWMDSYLRQLENIRVCQGVGGTFDVITGNVKRAPKLFIKINCEWLYRLLTQPKRLIRQTALPIFAYKVLLSVLRENLCK